MHQVDQVREKNEDEVSYEERGTQHTFFFFQKPSQNLLLLFYFDVRTERRIQRLQRIQMPTKRVCFELGIDQQISPPIAGVDLEIMKGVAQSGVMKPGQPTLVGLYLPRQKLVRCTNLPKNSSEYIQAQQFTGCGLSRTRRPIAFDISTRRTAIYWKTHSDREDKRILHRPPTVGELKEALTAARNKYDTTLLVLTSKSVWILVSTFRDFEGIGFESPEVNHEVNHMFQEYAKYTDYIQTNENFRKWHSESHELAHKFGRSFS